MDYVGRNLWRERKHLLNKQKKSKRIPRLGICLMPLLETSEGCKKPPEEEVIEITEALKNRRLKNNRWLEEQPVAEVVEAPLGEENRGRRGSTRISQQVLRQAHHRVRHQSRSNRPTIGSAVKRSSRPTIRSAVKRSTIGPAIRSAVTSAPTGSTVRPAVRRSIRLSFGTSPRRSP